LVRGVFVAEVLLLDKSLTSVVISDWGFIIRQKTRIIRLLAKLWSLL